MDTQHIALGNLKATDIRAAGIELPLTAIRQLCEAGRITAPICQDESYGGWNVGWRLDVESLAAYYADNPEALASDRQWFEANKPKKKPTAKQVVTDHADVLKAMTTHGDLHRWSRSHGFDSASGFSAFKKALKSELNIDYDALRHEAKQGRLDTVASAATKQITLYSDAKASKDRFGITDADGEPVWYGRLFSEYEPEQSATEMEAAKKAVWLAGKIAKLSDLDGIRLNLYVDAQWLVAAGYVKREPEGKSGGKARALGEAALRQGVDLHVTHVPGTENPADAYTICAGYQKWSDRDDLTELVEDSEE